MPTVRIFLVALLGTFIAFSPGCEKSKNDSNDDAGPVSTAPADITGVWSALFTDKTTAVATHVDITLTAEGSGIHVNYDSGSANIFSGWRGWGSLGTYDSKKGKFSATEVGTGSTTLMFTLDGKATGSFDGDAGEKFSIVATRK